MKGGRVNVFMYNVYMIVAVDKVKTFVLALNSLSAEFFRV